METLFFILCILGYLAVGVLVGGLWGHVLGYAEYDPVPEALAVTLVWPPRSPCFVSSSVCSHSASSYTRGFVSA
jgi:hypothetical protein